MNKLENHWINLEKIWYGRYSIGVCPKIVLFNFLQSVTPTWHTNLWGEIDTSTIYIRAIQWCMVTEFWRIQNVAVKWFTLMFHIQDASRLKSVWRLANVIVFSLFSSVPPGKYQNGNLKSGHKCFLPNPFQFTIHSLWRFTKWLQSY
jgi:hypothetical protein